MSEEDNNNNNSNNPNSNNNDNDNNKDVVKDTVDKILLNIVDDDDSDDNLYKGYDRSITCLRCIDHGFIPPGRPRKLQFAYCDNCMNELDRAPYVRAIMKEIRKSMKY